MKRVEKVWTLVTALTILLIAISSPAVGVIWSPSPEFIIGREPVDVAIRWDEQMLRSSGSEDPVHVPVDTSVTFELWYYSSTIGDFTEMLDDEDTWSDPVDPPDTLHAWFDFDNDGVQDDGEVVEGFAVSIAHTFSSSDYGLKAIPWHVRDMAINGSGSDDDPNKTVDGWDAEGTTYVQIDEWPIDLSVTASITNICMGESVTITATASDVDAGQSGSPVNDTVDQFTWTGIGTAVPTYSYDPQTHVSTSTVTLSWDTTGSKIITVSADDHFYYTDDTAVNAEEIVSVEVLPEPPIRAGAVFRKSVEDPWQASNIDVGVGSTILFKGDSEVNPTIDEDARNSDCQIVNDTISSYSWDFGDSGTATGPDTSHTYNTAGSYVISLTVDDTGSVNDDPVSEPAQLGIRVFADEPGVPTITQPEADLAWCSPAPIVRWTGETHDSLQVKIGQVDDPDNTTWDWDSGTVASEESWVVCPVELAEETQYYVFVREHNVLGWGAWSATGYGFTVKAGGENPENLSLDPDSGTFVASTAVPFTVSYNDSCRYGNISTAELLIDDSTMDKANACLVKYDEDTNTCWLADNSGVNWLGGYEPGSENDIENDQVTVHLADTAVDGTDETLTVTWNLEFKNAFAGEKNVALAVANNYGMADQDNYEEFGTITVEPDSGPISTITSPTNGEHVTSVPVTISGTAASGNGISKVEISTDDGESWVEATGTTTWSYTWSDAEDGHYTIKSRAYDGQQNVETPGTGIMIAVDTVLPTSTIYQPIAGETIVGDKISISGSAYDPTSKITEVNISVNNGSWQKASGTSAFLYEYPVTESGTYTIRSRATDESGQEEVPGTGTTVTVQYEEQPQPPPSGGDYDPIPLNLNTNIFEAQRTQKLGEYTSINLCTGQILTAVPLVSWKSAGDLGIEFTMYHQDIRPDRFDGGTDKWMHSYQMTLTPYENQYYVKLYHPNGEVQYWQRNGQGGYTGLYGNTDTVTVEYGVGWYVTTKDKKKLHFTYCLGSDVWALKTIEQLGRPTPLKIELIYNSATKLLEWVKDPDGIRWLRLYWWKVGPDNHNAIRRVCTSQYFVAAGESTAGKEPQRYWFGYDGNGDLSSIKMPYKMTYEIGEDKPLIPSWAKTLTYSEDDFDTPKVEMKLTYNASHYLTSVEKGNDDEEWRGYKLNYISYNAAYCPGVYSGTVETVRSVNGVANGEDTDSKVSVVLECLYPYDESWSCLYPPPDSGLPKECEKRMGMTTRIKTTVTDSRGHRTIYYHALWHGPSGDYNTQYDNTYYTEHRSDSFLEAGRSWWSGFRIFSIETTDKGTNGASRNIVENFDWIADGPVGAARLNWYQDPKGRKTSFLWDANGNLLKVTPPSNEITNTTYTTFNKPDTITEPSGRVTKHTYNPSTYDLTKTQIDPNGLNITTEYEYNDYGNIKKVIGPYYGPDRPTGVPTTQYVYTAPGIRPCPTKITDPAGRFTTFGYTNLGYKQIQNLSRLKSTDLPLKLVWDYDKSGKVYYQFCTGDTDSGTWYDHSGNVEKTRDANGNLTTFEYDDHGRLKFEKRQVTDTNWLVTKNLYDEASNVTAVYAGFQTGENDPVVYPVVHYKYDDLNRPWIIRSPLNFPNGDKETITYDELGNVSEKTDCRGYKTKYIYNYDTRRLTEVQFLKPDKTLEKNVTYDYYPAGGSSVGLLWKVNDWTVTGGPAREYIYDTSGRVSTLKCYDVDRKILYDYTASGKPAQITLQTLAGGAIGRYIYDYNPDDSLKSVNDPDNLTTTFEYDDYGRFLKKIYPYGPYVKYAYQLTGPTGQPDARSLVQTVKQRGSGFEYDYGYTYDNVGNIQTLNDGRGTVAYSYDDAYRLLGETRTGTGAYNYWYTYDSLGNRLTKTVIGQGTTTFNYDADNKLTSSTDGYTYGYDDDGNMTSKTLGSDTWTYEYDATGNLVKMTPPSGPEGYFTYNSSDERIETIDSRGTRKYVYVGGDLFYELDSNNALKVWYNPGISQTADGTKRYFRHDAQGSMVALTKTSVSPEVFIYDAWGNRVYHTGTTFTPYRYVGKEGYYYDLDTGLTKLGARYYDPKIGRFITKDPARDGLNWYAYAGNDPVNAIDPTGMYDVGQWWDNFKGSDWGGYWGDVGANLNAIGSFAFPHIDPNGGWFDTTCAATVPMGGGLLFRFGQVGEAAMAGLSARFASPIAGITANRLSGLAFEEAALDAQGLAKNTRALVGGTPGGFVSTILDSLGQGALWEVKSGRYVCATPQIRAGISIARNAGMPYNLIVHPQTRVADTVLEAIRGRGSVKVFDPVANAFSFYIH